MLTHLIKIYHGFDKGKTAFRDFLENLGKTLSHESFTLGLNYHRGEFFYSLSSSDTAYPMFESQFYSSFDGFQIVADDKNTWGYDPEKVVLGEIGLENGWFFPFELDTGNDTEFIYNLFRTFENLDIVHDKLGIYIEVTPIEAESFIFYIQSTLAFFWFRLRLSLRVFQYLFNHKIAKDWKQTGFEYFRAKIHKELFRTKVFILAQSTSKEASIGKLHAVFNNFLVFKHYPLNQFTLKTERSPSFAPGTFSPVIGKNILSSEEIASFFCFPSLPKNETSLLKVTSRKLALPIGIPTFDYTRSREGEILPKETPGGTNILGISDYRSIRIPVGIYDEDRLRHTYVIGKTGVGKSKFLMSLIIDDIKKGKGLGIIDPHGDLIEEALMAIPESRKGDVIIFDPTDEKFPFCLNPLDVKRNESKQILAKGFIDIFKKFFGANWNPKLEHVLRMVFLALLDKKDATLFDIIRALTDKDFRYTMIESIGDDVVRNFWTNEFAGWSQQFNTEAIMPILNKVGQLLSIDILKNIFASPLNKLDFSQVMDEHKILLIKLPKGKLQEEIMGFLGAMFVTKIYQAAMARQGMDKDKRTPFFLYVDEFQNFATDTFSEILSEARKYGLGLVVAHQFISQIPKNISESLFGNVGSIVSFRISSEDALYMKQHFDPFIEAYDLANLNQREFYMKTLVNGQVKDPFSLRTAFIDDALKDPKRVEMFYAISRKTYARSLEEAKKVVAEKQKDVVEKMVGFSEPIL